MTLACGHGAIHGTKSVRRGKARRRVATEAPAANGQLLTLALVLMMIHCVCEVKEPLLQIRVEATLHPVSRSRLVRNAGGCAGNKTRSGRWRAIQCMTNSVAAHRDRPLLRCSVVPAMIAMGHCSAGLSQPRAAAWGAARLSAAMRTPSADADADDLLKTMGRAWRVAEGSR